MSKSVKKAATKTIPAKAKASIRASKNLSPGEQVKAAEKDGGIPAFLKRKPEPQVVGKVTMPLSGKAALAAIKGKPVVEAPKKNGKNGNGNGKHTAPAPEALAKALAKATTVAPSLKAKMLAMLNKGGSKTAPKAAPSNVIGFRPNVPEVKKGQPVLQHQAKPGLKVRLLNDRTGKIDPKVYTIVGWERDEPGASALQSAGYIPLTGPAEDGSDDIAAYILDIVAA
jgi:hypothetical protein